MKSQRIGLTALITLLSTVSTPFTPNSPTLLPAPAAFSQPAPSSEPGSQICEMRSQSMIPTVPLYDHVVINQLAYRSQSPKRGDIIVFKPTKYIRQDILSFDLGGPLIKRVIGLPGETVKVVDGKVYINNKPLKEKYIKHKPQYVFAPVTIPANSYFVLGDNRNNSYDSHSWGFVPQELIIGQVVRIVGSNSQAEQKQLKSDLAQSFSKLACRLY